MANLKHKKPQGRRLTGSIADRYRDLLKPSRMSDQQLAATRQNMRTLALVICEHVWRRLVL